MVAGRCQHPLDLVVFALLEHDLDLVLAVPDAAERLEWRRFVVQFDARQQFIDQRLGDRFLRRGLVNLGHVALGGGLRVDEGAVVGHQQHAGGVMVEPADRLHVAPGKLLGQQGQHARMVARFARAFIVGRLVERDVDPLADDPFVAEHGQHQGVGVERGFVIGVRGAGDGHFAIFDQCATVFARAEALRLKDAVQG